MFQKKQCEHHLDALQVLFKIRGDFPVKLLNRACSEGDRGKFSAYAMQNCLYSHFSGK